MTTQNNMAPADVGLTGLAVMGENLVLNMAGRGFRVAVYNRTEEKTKDFLNNRAQGGNIVGTFSHEEFIKALSRPRKIMLMVKAGLPVDDLIESYIPYMDPGDILIDCGNSHFQDTNRRVAQVESLGFWYVGSGVSGGEEGALKGPSIMPGGSERAWETVKPILRDIAARADDGEPCCQWIGPQGAGHFVKMVHNGIEYAYMQMIADAYQIMRDLLKISPKTIQETFSRWNQGPLKSHLIEITAEILNHLDANNRPLVDLILDASSQKGTGKWTVESGLDLGQPLTVIGDAVFARALSAEKELRVKASQMLNGPASVFSDDLSGFLEDLEQALWAAQVIAYTQGFSLIQEASSVFNWSLNLGEIAAIWRAGCIIRSALLEHITQGFRRNPGLSNLLFDSYFQENINKAQAGLRRVAASAVANGIPASGLTAALGYYDALRTARLPHDLIQAQRDYFGAHLYERVDRPRGELFHRDWLGQGEESQVK